MSSALNAARSDARTRILRLIPRIEIMKRTVMDLEKTNPAAAKKIVYQNLQILALRKHQALAVLNARG
jgi:hypothetical protein